MFLRMFMPDNRLLNNSLEQKDGELHMLASEFSSQIPENTFTPAQLQGYLLNHRNCPSKAATDILAWVDEEKVRREEARLRAEKAKKWRAGKKKTEAMKLLSRTVEAGNLAMDIGMPGLSSRGIPSQDIPNLSISTPTVQDETVGVPEKNELSAETQGATDQDKKPQEDITEKKEDIHKPEQEPTDTAGRDT